MNVSKCNETYVDDSPQLCEWTPAVYTAMSI